MSEALVLTLPARSENVAVVRHAIAGLAEAAGMEPSAVADLKTILTEACMNVVVHAYGGEEGPLEVTADLEDDALLAVVRDFGRGIHPRAEVERRSLRLGLPLIAALSSAFEIKGGPGRGTEVRMRVHLSPRSETPSEERPGVRNETVIAMEAGRLVGAVLSRVISMLAARVDFSVDRVSDTMLLGDAISAHSPADFAQGVARISVGENGSSIAVRVGPLVEGGGERLTNLMRIPGLDASLVSLADEVRVERGDGVEHLVIEIGTGP